MGVPDRFRLGDVDPFSLDELRVYPVGTAAETIDSGHRHLIQYINPISNGKASIYDIDSIVG